MRVHLHRLAGAVPLTRGYVRVAERLLLLRVHAHPHQRLARGQMQRDLLVDVPELRITVGAAHPVKDPAGALQLLPRRLRRARRIGARRSCAAGVLRDGE